MVEGASGERRPRGRPARPRVVIPCYLREEQANGLRLLSEQRDVPQSIIIREAIDRVLKEAGV
jgi:hypothetical protein